MEQFIKRVHRLGQTKRVMVHPLIATGTIDEGVLKVLKSKDKSQRALMKALALHIEDDYAIQRPNKEKSVSKTILQRASYLQRRLQKKTTQRSGVARSRKSAHKKISCAA
jgi:SNF2 family DNA or RNA helicase